MFIVVQFPFADSRAFLPADTGRLPTPAWPLPQPLRDFVRGFGQVETRHRGGLADWPGEEVYASARHAVRFEGNLRDRRLGPLDALLIPFCAFRRFHSDGGAVCRIELGLRNFHHHRRPRALDGAGVLSLINAVLEVPVFVPLIDRRPGTRALIDASPELAAYCLRATTRSTFVSKGTIESWWFTPGTPVMLVEYRDKEVAEFPRYTMAVSALRDQGIELAHTWVQLHGKRLGVWFLRRDRHGVRLEEQGEADKLRRLRLHLFRLHAEFESLRHVLSHVANNRITLEAYTLPTDRLQLYLLNAVRLLSRNQRYGFPQPSLLEVAYGATALMSAGELASLLSQLTVIRRNVARNVERLARSRIPQPLTFHILGGQQTIAVGTDLTIGGQTMTNYDIKFGDVTVTSGNFVVASTIQDSFNKIQRSGVSEELKQRLQELSVAVAEMAKHLPPEKTEEAAKDLAALTNEATSNTPRRKWYELSAEGLLEAAKAVGEVAGPVVTAVKTILTLLA